MKNRHRIFGGILHVKRLYTIAGALIYSIDRSIDRLAMLVLTICALVIHLFLFLFTLIVVLVGTVFNRWIYFALFTFLVLFNIGWVLGRKRASHVIRILSLNSLIASGVFWTCIMLPAIVAVEDDARLSEFLFIYPLSQIASWVVWAYAIQRRYFANPALPHPINVDDKPKKLFGELNFAHLRIRH